MFSYCCWLVVGITSFRLVVLVDDSQDKLREGEDEGNADDGKEGEGVGPLRLLLGSGWTPLLGRLLRLGSVRVALALHTHKDTDTK